MKRENIEYDRIHVIEQHTMSGVSFLSSMKTLTPGSRGRRRRCDKPTIEVVGGPPDVVPPWPPAPPITPPPAFLPPGYKRRSGTRRSAPAASGSISYSGMPCCTFSYFRRSRNSVRFVRYPPHSLLMHNFWIGHDCAIRPSRSAAGR